MNRLNKISEIVLAIVLFASLVHAQTKPVLDEMLLWSETKLF